MYHIVKTDKSFEQAVVKLEESVKNNGYGVLHIHNLGETLRNKGQSFSEECKIFEVCNPVHAAQVLSTDMRLNMALPCRISVYTEKGETKIGVIEPEKMLTALSTDQSLLSTAKQVEEQVLKMIEEAK